MPELNPDNKALTQLREHWQKVLMLVMRQRGIKEVTLDAPDFQWHIDANTRGEMPHLVTIGREHIGPHGGFTLILCDTRAEAMDVTIKHGLEIKAAKGK